ncbi:MAG: FAD-dependent oxidoreductase [Cyanobacteria bacterium Co-bin13]|nr:FAD-dependent oxidoreductase [Cyanobacteria bacterium Co-bin13]
MAFDYDLLVIGAGSAGLSAAKTAARLGARVAIADPGPLGGTCVNRGCIPKKFLVYAADFVRQQQQAKHYGWKNLAGEFDWPTLRDAIQGELKQLQQSQAKGLEKAGVTVLPHEVRFVDEHCLLVGEQQVTADKVIIAVGAKPVLPDLPGIDCGLTSRDIFQLPELPQRWVIVGGGYIGVEFGCLFNLLGCQVTLADKHALVLEGFDQTLREQVHQGLIDQGLNLLPETALSSIEPQGQKKKVCLSGASSDAITTDVVLLALGRKPDLSRLDLDKAGVTVEEGAIAVDAHSRTSQPSILAVGDCTNRKPLTPVAKAEGTAAAKTLFGSEPAEVPYRWVPSAVFCFPEIASVGWSEAEAQEHEPVEVHCHTFVPLNYKLTSQKPEALIKLVVAKGSQEILGLHVVSDASAEIVQGLIPALRRGLTLSELTETIAIHPTSAEEIFSLS